MHLGFGLRAWLPPKGLRGKVFGPPGIMAAAASGRFGTDVVPEYGLFPRALVGAFQEVRRRRAAGKRLVLTASAVELTWDQGNVDMSRRALALTVTTLRRRQ